MSESLEEVLKLLPRKPCTFCQSQKRKCDDEETCDPCRRAKKDLCDRGDSPSRKIRKIFDERLVLLSSTASKNIGVPDDFENLICNIVSFDNNSLVDVIVLAKAPNLKIDFSRLTVEFKDRLSFAIVEWFFDHIHQYGPISSAITLKHAAVDVNTTDGNIANVNGIVLITIMSLIIYRGHTLVDGEDSLNLLITSDLLRTKAVEELSEWQKSLPYFTVDTTIATIQGYTFLYLRFRDDNRQLAIAYLHHALSEAIRICLHKEEFYSENNTTEGEMLRSLWWFIYLCNVAEDSNGYDMLCIFKISTRLPVVPFESMFGKMLHQFRRQLMIAGHIQSTI